MSAENSFWSLSGALKRIWARLKCRSDSEHEQAIVRAVIVFVLTAFVLWSAYYDETAAQGFDTLIYIGLGYSAFSCIYFFSIIVWPQPSPSRRLSAMVMDFAVLSSLLHLGEAAAAPFYPVYLWTAFGYGFRYGLRDLGKAVAAAFCGFSFVIATTDYWREELPIALGLLAALIVLPAYAASLIKKLTEAKAQAEAASQAKSQFLASVSHDLRTPLNAIIGISELIGHSPLNRDQMEMIYTIKTSGGSLLSLIDGILDLSRIEAGKVSVDTEAFDLHREIADTITILGPQARQKGLALGANISPRVPAALEGDVRRLRQILLNLTANAVKFTNYGHVVINVDLPAETVGPDVLLRFEVIDTGIGIPETDQNRVFDRFVQSSGTAKHSIGGAGLGLAIAKNLTDLLKGRMGVQSEVGKGSVFWVEVAFARQTASKTHDILKRAQVFLVSENLKSANGLRHRFLECGIDLSILTNWQTDLQTLVDLHEPAIIIVDSRAQGPDIAVIAETLHIQKPNHSMALIQIVSSRERPLPNPNIVATLQPPFESDEIINAIRIADLSSFGGSTAIAGVDSQSDEDSQSENLRILIAEDNPINRKITARILQHGGHEALAVSSGDEALALLRETDFDVMIVDINMPGISGIDVVKLHRMAEGSSAHLPIIVVSADATPETSRACEAAGADAFLTKPVEARRLLDTIQGTYVRFEDKQASVTQISAHPKFHGDVVPAIDWKALSSLRDLVADDSFLLETLSEYLTDSQSLITEIADAVAELDPQAFRDGIHALRGTSGNVGAQSLRHACEEITGITRNDLKQSGQEYIRRLERELIRYKTELSHSENLTELSKAL